MLFFTIPNPFRMRNPEFVKAAFSAIAPRYVATNHVLSMGVDLLWRQRVVQLVSEWKPENLLDLATGTGHPERDAGNPPHRVRLLPAHAGHSGQAGTGSSGLRRRHEPALPLRLL